MDISTLSYQELSALRDQLDKELVVRKEQEKQRILAQLNSAAAASGFTVAELLGQAGKQTGKKNVVKAKFANPKNASDTWSGRGRKPLWVHEALAAGATLESLAI